MTNTLTGTLLSHTTTISGLTTGDNYIYTKCIDASNNTNTSDFTTTINVLSGSQLSFSTPYIWATNFNTNQVAKVDLSGNVLGDYNMANNPRGIAVDLDGNVWVTNTGSSLSKVNYPAARPRGITAT